MNDNDRKQDLIKALGLTPVTTGNKTMASSHDSPNSSNNQTGTYTNIVRRRFSRRRKNMDGMNNHLFHFLTNEPVGTYKDRPGLTPKKKVTTTVTTSSSVTASMAAIGSTTMDLVNRSAKLQPVQQNVVFLPNNQSSQGIILGQTVFQGPDGKKFILVPSSKAQEKVNVQVSQNQIGPPVVPIAANIKVNANPDAANANYVYLPAAQKSAMKQVAYSSIVPANILPSSSLIVTATTSAAPIFSVGNQSLAQAQGTQSNVIQLVNVTRSPLISQMPVSVGVWPQNTNQTFQLVKIQQKPQQLALKNNQNLTSSSSMMTSCVTITSSGMNPPLASVSNPSNPDSYKHASTSQHTLMDGVSKHTLNASSINTAIVSAALCTSTHVQPPKHASPEMPIVLSAGNPCNNASIIMQVDANTKRCIPNEPLELSTQNSPQGRIGSGIISSEASLESSKKHPAESDPNCVVIQGKTKRRRGKGKVYETQRRRYIGPPFTPCNNPPPPNTPRSSTCCLYEHTLLKMATRGFWGCEMGKLQDVFRSIRCESIDFDTMEDVTKRCFGFVRRKLLDAGDGKEDMYKYMKNYVDEFDSFLNRVYPVAIIAILIYLPTAADYTYVTWHGIPPTGWSEYRRAVVMREVFEVFYRFGTQLDLIPEYRREYFDNPVQSQLLIPRVFDLRKNYSDPPTCCVQKAPQQQNITKSIQNGIEPERSIANLPGVAPIYRTEIKIDPDGRTMRSESGQQQNPNKEEIDTKPLIIEQTDFNDSQINTQFPVDENMEGNVANRNEAVLNSVPNSADKSGNLNGNEARTVKDSCVQEENKMFCDLEIGLENGERHLHDLKMQSEQVDSDISGNNENCVDHDVFEENIDNLVPNEDNEIEPNHEDTSEVAKKGEISDRSFLPKTTVISASFAESIAAACGDRKSSRDDASFDIPGERAEQGHEIGLDREMRSVMKRVARRRRSSKRKANVTSRFDNFIHESEDVKLERDLKRALKLSKRDFAVSKRSNEQCDDMKSPVKITDRITLKNALNEIGEMLQIEGCDMKLPTVNRSVAFEALWTKKSVEEPIVMLNDSTSYNLGEYLERFPIETHCPPSTTFIMACNEKYNARDILGYLRRGTQLVEQIGNEIVIDTTRTIKANAIALAVRKVPPGRISKLIHPELHLETYTGFLLPVGVTQPSKLKKSWARSFKAKRKSTHSKDDALCKVEPDSPSYSTSFNIGESEDSCMSPPLSKKFVGENANTCNAVQIELADVKDAEIQTSNADNSVSAETQTDTEMNNGTLHEINSIESIESLEEVLNASIEKAIAFCTISRPNVTDNHGDSSHNLINSYERAGKLLLNIAKILRKHSIADTDIKYEQ